VIHPKTLLISRHFYSLESYVWRSIYNLKIDTISTYDIPLDRSFLKLWNGIRHVMPSIDRRLELKEKTSMAQNAWQAFVYANGLIHNNSGIKTHTHSRNTFCEIFFYICVGSLPTPVTSYSTCNIFQNIIDEYMLILLHAE